MRRIVLIVASLCACVVLMSATPARAADYTFTASGGALSASAAFTYMGGTNLQIVLTNTGGDALAPPDVLTALFFNCSCGTLSPVSATLTSGSTVFFDADGQPAGGIVGGEWAYNDGLVGAPWGATRGISSSGLDGVFGDANFPGANLDGATALNGLNYGILSTNDDTATGNAGVTGQFPLIKSSVTFLLSGYTGGTVTSNTFSNMSFQYGTSLTEPNLGGGSGGGSGQTLVPEPTSLLLLGSGLALAAQRVRRQKQKDT